MSGKPAILCVGRLYCDLVFTGLPRLPTMGTEVFATGAGLFAGGGAFITAAHLSALGHAASLAAMLPSPPFDQFVARDLAAAEIDLRLCRPLDIGAEPQVTAAMAGQGDRAFVTRRSGPACPAFDAGALKALGVRHVHVGELATLVERPDLARLARDAGATLSLDCGWDEALCAADIAPVLADLDLFLPNEAEQRHLRTIGLCPPFAPLTVVKRGARGATAYRGNDTVHAPAGSVAVVDPTGAGDAFNAGFLSAWLDGAGLAESLAAGNRQGALAIGRPGGFAAAQAAGDGPAGSGRLA